MSKTILSVILILTSIFSVGQDNNKYSKIMDSLLRENKKDELIKYLNNEVKLYPNNEDLLRSLGYTYILNRQFDLGEKQYRKAIIVNPSCGRCYMNLGLIYTEINKSDSAKILFDKAIEIDPKDATLYEARANYRDYTNNYIGAMNDYNKALKIDPKSADAYLGRALLNEKLHYLFSAISDLNKANEIEPKESQILFHRARLYYEQKMLDEALNDISSAIELDSTIERYFALRGVIYDLIGENYKAIDNYTKTYQLNPRDYITILNRANLKYKLEDMDGFCDDIHLCLKILQGQQMTAEDSLKYFETLNKINIFCDTINPSYYYQRGVAYYNLNQFDKAIDIYSKGLRKFNKNSMTLSFRGNAYLANGEFQKAIEDYRASIINSSNYKDDLILNSDHTGISKNNDSIADYIKASINVAQSSIAEALFELHKYDEALYEINIAIDNLKSIKDNVYPEHTYNVRGNIYLALGKYQLALVDFEKSIKLNQNFAIAYVNCAIAKMNINNKLKLEKKSTSIGLKNSTYKSQWVLPTKSLMKKSEVFVISAIADCDNAIKINPKLAFAHFIKGEIKRILEYPDYCYDILLSQELGYPVPKEYIENCKK